VGGDAERDGEVDKERIGEGMNTDGMRVMGVDMAEAGSDHSVVTEVTKTRRGRPRKVKKVKVPRKARVLRPIMAYMVNSTGTLTLIAEFPEGIKSVVKAREWARGQAEDGYRDVKFMRLLGSFKATPQMVMKFEVE
jgi:hypothetical protein